MKAKKKYTYHTLPLCECGQARKTAKNRGCAACNAKQGRYELSQVDSVKFRNRCNNPMTKYADWFITFLGTGGYRHKTPSLL